jgi:cell division protein FtsL
MIYGVPYYRRVLFIKAKNAKVTIPKTNTSLSRSKESAKGQKGFLDSIGVGVEWIAIWFLSVLGLILSVRRRHTIANLRDVQNEISETEEKIKKEIQSLEV